MVGGYAVGETTITVSPAGGGASKAISLKVIPSIKPLTLQAPSAIALVPGNKVSYLASGGVPPYRVVSSNPNVVVATTGTEGITLDAKLVGSASISVYDSGESEPVTREVTVGPAGKLFTTAPDSMTVAPNSSRMVSIGGGVAPYQVTSTNLKVVTVDVAGTVLTLRTPVGAAGEATVVVTDGDGTKVEFVVTVSSGSIPLALSSTAINIPVALPGGARIRIIGGSPPFTVTSAIPAALGAVVQSTVTDGVTTYEVVLTPKLAFKGLDVVVIDSVGKSVKATIEITTETTNIRLAPEALSISNGTSIALTVLGAVGDVRVFSSNVDIATATIKGGTVTVTTKAAGDVIITVVDSANNMATSKLTVK